MDTNALAAEAVLLAVEDSVVNGHSQGFILIHETTCFRTPSLSVAYSLITKHSSLSPEPFYQRVSRFSWFMKPIAQGSTSSVGCLQLRRFYKQYRSAKCFQPHKLITQYALHRSTHSGSR